MPCYRLDACPDHGAGGSTAGTTTAQPRARAAGTGSARAPPRRSTRRRRTPPAVAGSARTAHGATAAVGRTPRGATAVHRPSPGRGGTADPPPVSAHGPSRHWQIGQQPRQLVPVAGSEGAFHPFGELLRVEPAGREVLAQLVDRPLPLGVARPHAARRTGAAGRVVLRHRGSPVEGLPGHLEPRRRRLARRRTAGPFLPTAAGVRRRRPATTANRAGPAPSRTP